MYFLPSRTIQYRSQITSFAQGDGENLSEAWPRLKNLNRERPHHGLEEWLVLSSFYDGLQIHDQRALDLVTKGSFLNLSVKGVAKVITNLCESRSYQTLGPNTGSSAASMCDMNNRAAVHARLDELSELINDLLLKRNAQAQMAMCRTHL